MSRSELTTRIVTVGDSAAILLTQDEMNALGWKIGDELLLNVCGRTLTLRTREEEERRRKEFEDVTAKVFAENDSLLRRLAQSEREDRERAERESGR